MDTFYTPFKGFFFIILITMFGTQALYSQCSILRILETDPSCGLENGIITVVMDGSLPPYQYSIDNGITWQTSNVFDDLAAGDYIIRVMDGLGCIAIESPQLADSGFPTIGANIESCINESTQSIITLMVTGRDPFTYEWTNAATGFSSNDQDPGPLEPGTYDLTIIDDGGCQIDTFFIAEQCCRMTPQCALINEEISCLLDIPAINAAFLDNTADGKDDQNLVETLGIQLVGLNACNDVIVSARDSIGQGTGCVGSEIEVTRFYTLTDQVSTEVCRQTFTIVDHAAPDIFEPAKNLNLNCENTNDLVQQFNDWINAHGEALADDCNLISWSTIPSNPTINLDCNTQGITNIIFIAEDQCGNTSTTEAQFSVTDNSDPVINCPGELVLECSDPNYTNLIDSWVLETTSFDACSSTSIDHDLNMFNILPVCGNEYFINFEARDDCGKTSSCSAKIVFIDSEMPSLICPSDLVLQIGDSNGDVEIQNWLDQVSALDNCSSNLQVNNDFDPTTLNVSCGPADTQDIFFDVVDNCGNVNSCRANITLLGQIDSEIICPTALSLECNDPNNDQIIQDWLSTVEAYDSDGSIINVNNNFNVITNQDCNSNFSINFSATDFCGGVLQCSGQINFVDTGLPIITCPPTLNLIAQDPNNNDLIQDWLNQVAGQDDCSATVLSSDFDPARIDPICGVGGTFPVEFYAQDACGNGVDCIALIEIEYDASISLSCPPPLTLQCASDNNQVLVDNWLQDARANANATGESFFVDNDYTSTDGLSCGDQMLITFNAINECGDRFECNSFITLEDNESPNISCVENLIINIEDIDLNRFDEWINAVVASDDCGPATISNDFDPSLIDLSCNETVAVNFFTRDECDNENNCTAFYTVVDTRAPKLSCPGELEVACGDDVEALLNDHLAKISHTDNSGESELLFDIDFNLLDAIDCSQSMNFEFDVFAFDRCDNEESCVIRIKVKPDLKLYSPDIFSPNNDGINDRFTIYGNEFASIIRSLSIYDRWGNLVFSKEDLELGDEDEGWDGSFNGQKAQSGVYSYFAIIENGDQELEELKGSITAIK